MVETKELLQMFLEGAVPLLQAKQSHCGNVVHCKRKQKLTNGKINGVHGRILLCRLGLVTLCFLFIIQCRSHNTRARLKSVMMLFGNVNVLCSF